VPQTPIQKIDLQRVSDIALKPLWPKTTLACPETPSPAVGEILAASWHALVNFRRDNPMEFLLHSLGTVS
jgi:hypothetical protein